MKRGTENWRHKIRCYMNSLLHCKHIQKCKVQCLYLNMNYIKYVYILYSSLLFNCGGLYIYHRVTLPIDCEGLFTCQLRRGAIYRLNTSVSMHSDFYICKFYSPCLYPIHTIEYIRTCILTLIQTHYIYCTHRIAIIFVVLQYLDMYVSK